MRVSRHVHAPASIAWSILASPARWPEWGPSVREVRFAGDRVTPGARGRVRTPAGIWLSFTILEVEPGRSWTWRVLGMEATGHEVEPRGEGACVVHFTFPAWAAPYGLVCRAALERIARLAQEDLRESAP